MIRSVPRPRVRHTRPAFLAALGSLACALLTPWSLARADGLAPIARDQPGPVEATVLASPAPLQEGPTTWYVVVEEADETRRTGAERAELLLTPAGRAASDRTAALAIPLRRVSPTGPLWSGDGALTRTGPWHGRVRLRSAPSSDGRAPAEALEMSFEAVVAPRTSPILEHWPALSIAPLGLTGLALHQALTRRRRHPGAPR